jgi:hypothetical protein
LGIRSRNSARWSCLLWREMLRPPASSLRKTRCGSAQGASVRVLSDRSPRTACQHMVRSLEAKYFQAQ